MASVHGSLTVHAFWSDGTPAADVAIVFRPRDDPELARSELRVPTDDQGAAHVERIHAGRVRLG